MTLLPAGMVTFWKFAAVTRIVRASSAYQGLVETVPATVVPKSGLAAPQ